MEHMERNKMYIARKGNTYITYECAIENVAYAMGVLHTYADAGNCAGGHNAALSAAYTRLERVMEALQDGGVVAID